MYVYVCISVSVRIIYGQFSFILAENYWEITIEFVILKD